MTEKESKEGKAEPSQKSQPREEIKEKKDSAKPGFAPKNLAPQVFPLFFTINRPKNSSHEDMVRTITPILTESIAISMAILNMFLLLKVWQKALNSIPCTK
jgi:hypothetical protein